MSQPDKEWIIQQIKRMLGEIDNLVLTSPNLTNSIREIISSNTNEIEIKIYELVHIMEKTK